MQPEATLTCPLCGSPVDVPPGGEGKIALTEHLLDEEAHPRISESEEERKQSVEWVLEREFGDADVPIDL